MYTWEDTIDWASLKKQGTLSIDRTFYEICAAPKIHERFASLESRIAVGLVGEGSECFGFDDEISRDHDFELGFCMWLKEEDFKAFGRDLQAFYMELMEHEGKVFSSLAFGKDVSFVKERVAGRRGVMDIAGFYARILRLNAGLDKLVGQKYWMYAEPRFLATATNGAVFRDDEGMFTAVRNEILHFYPAKNFYFKLAEQLHLFSHGGQSNYPRMMARRDYVTAHVCVDQTILHAMYIAYLLDRKYPPYYKWTRRGLLELSILPELPGLLERLALLPVQTQAWENYTYSSLTVNRGDAVINTIEEIAALLVEEMLRQGLIDRRENFLESHVQTLAAKGRNG